MLTTLIGNQNESSRYRTGNFQEPMHSDRMNISNKAVPMRATSSETDLKKLEQEVAYYQEMLRIKEMEKKRLIEKKRNFEVGRNGANYSTGLQSGADLEKFAHLEN